jgi:hypothetical protein
MQMPEMDGYVTARKLRTMDIEGELLLWQEMLRKMTETDASRQDAMTIYWSLSSANNWSQFVLHCHPPLPKNRYDSSPPGGVAEWPNTPDLKSGMPARASWVSQNAPPNATMLRYPDISENRIGFSYANGLLTVGKMVAQHNPLRILLAQTFLLGFLQMESPSHFLEIMKVTEIFMSLQLMVPFPSAWHITQVEKFLLIGWVRVESCLAQLV